MQIRNWELQLHSFGQLAPGRLNLPFLGQFRLVESRQRRCFVCLHHGNLEFWLAGFCQCRRSLFDRAGLYRWSVSCIGVQVGSNLPFDLFYRWTDLSCREPQQFLFIGFRCIITFAWFLDLRFNLYYCVFMLLLLDRSFSSGILVKIIRSSRCRSLVAVLIPILSSDWLNGLVSYLW